MYRFLQSLQQLALLQASNRKSLTTMNISNSGCGHQPITHFADVTFPCTPETPDTPSPASLPNNVGPSVRIQAPPLNAAGQIPTAGELSDVSEIARSLRLFTSPEDIGEVRVIGCGGHRGAVSLHYTGTEVEKVARRAAEMSLNAKGVYVIMNSIPLEFIERSPLVSGEREISRSATRDADVVQRRWLLIDFDPHSAERGADDSATDDEKEAACERMETVREYLAEKEFPIPVVADSGNGFHLLYRIDLPNDNDSRELVKGFLVALSSAYSDETVEIDRGVHNASRITKLYGTWARKGTDRPERPHRVSRILSVPEVLTPVTRELIQEVIDAIQPATCPPTSNNRARVPGTSVSRRRPGLPIESDERLKVPEIIQPGNRHNTLLQIAASIRSIGLGEEEISSTLTAVIQHRMEDEFPEEEVSGIARWAASQDANDVLAARVFGRSDDELEEAERRQRLRLGIEHIQRKFAEPNANSAEIFVGLQRLLDLQPVSGEQTLNTISSAELASTRYTLDYLIPGLLVKGQPCVLAGPKKCLKTNILVDLTLSLATGSDFLNHFSTRQPCRVALLSGESGAATIKETALRVAKSKTITPLGAAENAQWCFSLPKLGQPDTVRTLIDYVKRHELEVLCVDPAYLCMPIGEAAGNLFVVGRMLADLSKVTDETGVTIVLAHHTTKVSSAKGKGFDPFAPPELEHIAWSGFQEWARQWLLLGRRERYDPELAGQHKLWLAAGGSAGHSGMWGIDIFEGRHDDLHGRVWRMTVKTASSVINSQKHERQDSAERQRVAAKQQRLDQDIQTAVRAYQHYPAGETSTHVRNTTGMNSERWGIVQAQLLEQGVIVAVTVAKNGRRHPGFKLVTGTGTTGTVPVNPVRPGERGMQQDAPLYRGGGPSPAHPISIPIQ